MKIIIFTAILLFLTPIVSNAQELKPRDGFRITIFNIPDKVSGDYFIQNDSTLQLPFIGNIGVRGKEYSSLKKEIIEKYQSIYRNPEITVEPLYRISVLGEVKQPGEYYITGVEKITDLIAKAGGETLDADLSDVILTRNGNEIAVDTKNILENGDSSSDISLEPGDRIYVTQKWIGGAQNTNVILYAVAVLVAITGIILR